MGNDNDQGDALWEKISRLAEKSMIKMMDEQKEIQRKETIRNISPNHDRLIIEYTDYKSGKSVKKTFNGRWLIEDAEYIKDKWNVSVAKTEKNEYVAFFASVKDSRGYDVVFSDFAQLSKSEYFSNSGMLLAKIAARQYRN